MRKLTLPKQLPQAPFDVVVIGTSLGGVRALEQVVSSIPPDFPVPIAIVQHRTTPSSTLAHILARQTRLLVTEARQGQAPEGGVIYLAPGGRHLCFSRTGCFALVDSRPVNFVRPAVDVLFQSSAACFKNRVLAVVMTGKGVDGAQGARAIKAAGGVVIAQDRASSIAFDMPRAAIQAQQVDFVLSLDMIGPAVVTLTMMEGAAKLFRVPDFPSYYAV